MNKLSMELTKLLYARFCSIYADKFVKSYSTPEFIQVWWEEWSEGMAGIDPNHIKEGLSYCRLNLEWPPSIAEFRRICEKASGIPSADESLNLAIRREFNHPVIKLAFDKVGSWSMKNDKQADLKSKFNAAYQEALNHFRQNTEQSWKQLEQFKSQPSLPEPLPKIPTAEECKFFRERFSEYKQKSKEETAEQEFKKHPTWDKSKIVRGGKKFDQEYYNERKNYLLSVGEVCAGNLEREDWYDRVRFKREIIASEAIKYNSISSHENNKKTQPRGSYAAKTVYDRWGD